MNRLFFSLFVISFLTCEFISAQTQENQPLFDPQQKKYQTSFEKYYKERSIIRPIINQVLENDLEAENYIVGPGDQFKIYIFGELEQEINFDISPEGNAVIPTIGEYKVSGLSLAAARQNIIDQAKKYYIRSDISVNLIGLRRFRVYIAGEVKIPGTYFVQGTDRVSDLVEVATGLTDWADDTKIQVRRDNTGGVILLNIKKFYLDGDKTQNPYLHGGDVVYIPAVDITRGYVIVESNVVIGEIDINKPGAEAKINGIFPLLENEMIFDFLRRIGALSKKSDVENIVVKRKGKEILINLFNQESEGSKLILADKDQIYIPPIVDKVYVKGAVFKPSDFPYEANHRAIDYVGQAGAMEIAAGADDYVVLRYSSGKKLRGGDTIVERGDTVIVPRKDRENFKDLMVMVTPILSLAISLFILLK